MIRAYQTENRKNRAVCAAFAAGSGAEIVPPAPLLEGDVFMYGCLRGLLPTLEQAQREGRTWYYADNAYFRRVSKDYERGYYRVTRNALQHDGRGTAGPERWRRLGLGIQPWRVSGRHILVCPPDAAWGQLWGFDHVAWLHTVKQRLSAVTRRPIVVRERSMVRNRQQPFVAMLHGCWALVTHSSNAAVEALLAGVPVFCTMPCAAYRMGLPALERIENPRMPDDRQEWAQNLAAAQWSLQEMRDGTCWQDLQTIAA